MGNENVRREDAFSTIAARAAPRILGFAREFTQGARTTCLEIIPLWEIFRSVYQMGHKPYIVGGF